MRHHLCYRRLYPVVLLALLVPRTLAATLHVPADYATIQSCIDAAVSGQDECLVAPGTYNELINFLGKAITLRSESGPEVTIIYGTGHGSVVTCTSGEGPASIIDGFTIAGGNGTFLGSYQSSTYYGGGFYIIGSSPTIRHNVIKGNKASFGAGLYIAGSPLIDGNDIIDNERDYYGPGRGIDLRGDATIRNNRFVGNEGGALWARGSPLIVNNLVMRNSLGISLASSNAVITKNRLIGNFGGIEADDDSSPHIEANVLAGNFGGASGVVKVTNYSKVIGNIIFGNGTDDNSIVVASGPVILANNTICENDAPYGAALSLNDVTGATTNNIIAFNSSGITSWLGPGAGPISYNCVYGNNGVDYWWTVGDRTGVLGNISADPRLADIRHGNFHLQPGSPCIDGGGVFAFLPEADIDGQPLAKASDGHVDIGADEADGTQWNHGPYTILRVNMDGNDANDGSSWSAAFKSIQSAVDACSQVGGEVWVATGVYRESIDVLPFTHMLAGFSGKTDFYGERDAAKNLTIIDPEFLDRRGCSVLGGGASTTIDGFTIRNGRSCDGGGLRLFHSSAMISNNTIRDCASTCQFASTTTGGGGISAKGGAPTISGNRVISNYSADTGGGLFIRNASAARLINNVIKDNQARYTGGASVGGVSEFAGNIVMDNYPSGATLSLVAGATVSRNIIAGNRGFGVRPFSYAGLSILDNNLIIGNNGDGIYMPYGVEIRNCTVAYNSGAGVSLVDGPTAITHGISAFNSQGITAGDAVPSVSSSCTYGNAQGDYQGMMDQAGINGNISADPLFAESASGGANGWGDNPSTYPTDESLNDDFGDLRLQPDSPCINAGDPGFVPALVETDLDGHSRVLCGRMDMGAYEFGIGDADCNGSMDFADIGQWSGCATDPTDPSQTSVIKGGGCEALDFDGDGDVDLRDRATLEQYFSGYHVWPCISNAECDDGVYCNGAERCVEFSCVAGQPPCESEYDPLLRCSDFLQSCLFPAVIDFETAPSGQPESEAVIADAYAQWNLAFRSEGVLDSPVFKHDVYDNSSFFAFSANANFPPGFNIVIEFFWPEAFAIEAEVMTREGATVTMIAKNQNGDVIATASSGPAPSSFWIGTLSLSTNEPIASVEFAPSDPASEVGIDNFIWWFY